MLCASKAREVLESLLREQELQEQAPVTPPNNKKVKVEDIGNTSNSAAEQHGEANAAAGSGLAVDLKGKGTRKLSLKT